MYVFLGYTLQYFEGKDSPFGDTIDFTYFYVVTITTVGYGDLSPVTNGGKIVMIIMLPILISVGAVIFAGIGSFVFQLFQRRQKGKITVKYSDHLVIFGYVPGATRRLIDAYWADPRYKDMEIVLCDAHVDEHPLDDMGIDFVRVADLSSDESLKRTNAAKAAKLLICGPNDETNGFMLAALRASGLKNHVVVALHDLANKAKLQNIGQAEYAPLGVLDLVVQALQDPGVTAFVYSIIDNHDGQVTLRFDVPDQHQSQKWGDLFVAAKRDRNITLVGISPDPERDPDHVLENPDWDFEILPGMALFGIAPGGTKLYG